MKHYLSTWQVFLFTGLGANQDFTYDGKSVADDTRHNIASTILPLMRASKAYVLPASVGRELQAYRVDYEDGLRLPEPVVWIECPVTMKGRKIDGMLLAEGWTAPDHQTFALGINNDGTQRECPGEGWQRVIMAAGRQNFIDKDGDEAYSIFNHPLQVIDAADIAGNRVQDDRVQQVEMRSIGRIAHAFIRVINHESVITKPAPKPMEYPPKFYAPHEVVRVSFKGATAHDILYGGKQ